MIDERRRAERALSEYAADTDPDKIDWPAAAGRIREARLRSGMREADLAHELEITIESYWDLESYDDEIFKCLTLKEVSVLGRALNVTPRVLLLGSDESNDHQRVTFTEIVEALSARLTREKITPERLGELIGWDVQPLQNDPAALWTYPIVALYDICRAVGVDWTAALPD